MKVGIVGAGAVGTACMFAMTLRGSAREVVLVNRSYERAEGAVADLQYGTALVPAVSLRPGHYADLRGARVVVITAGANEKSGGATDRKDSAGRLRLLGTNADIYRDVIPRIVVQPTEIDRLVQCANAAACGVGDTATASKHAADMYGPRERMKSSA